MSLNLCCYENNFFARIRNSSGQEFVSSLPGLTTSEENKVNNTYLNRDVFLID